MSFFVVTGMSGAGKSRAIEAMEDLGFFCIDNVPPQFLLPMANLAKDNSTARDLALVVDSRSKEMFTTFESELEKLKSDNVDFKLLFMDCSDEELLNRYKETRRKHPLMDSENISVEEAIDKERKILEPIKEDADFLIDTTYTNPHDLKKNIVEICQNAPLAKLQIKLVSFGYKYGIANDADIVFDVRCLPNPFYVEELKNLTGLDDPVYDYVFSFEQSRKLADKLVDMLEFTVPLYIEEGKSQLVVALGCTGGKHRSISFVRYLQDKLNFDGVNIISVHRDLKRFD